MIYQRDAKAVVGITYGGIKVFVCADIINQGLFRSLKRVIECVPR
jgi:hypothetical protein